VTATVTDEALERLELVLGGPVFFQTLRTAVELDLFTILAQHPGAPLDRLAQLTGVDRRPMRIVLLGCTALQLVEKRGPRYYNTPVSDSRLNRASPVNIVATVEFGHRIVYRAIFHLLDAVRMNTNAGLSEFTGTGDTIYERLAHAPDLERVFHAGLRTTSGLSVDHLLGHVDFASVRHVLDVGGGDGTVLSGLARRHPHLRGTLLERGSVCARARARFEAEELTDRVDAREVDCVAESFPSGPDCILLMHFLTIWSEETNRALVRKCHQTLPAGGRLVVFDGAQSNDERGPVRAARWSPYFLVLASGQGLFYTADEYAGWMRQAGFIDVEQQYTSPDHALVVGVRP
jgi:SAM-dependent methyltransferase